MTPTDKAHHSFLSYFFQVWILVFSCSSIWFLSLGGHYLAWGYTLGLTGQVGWLWTALSHRQWGIFAVSVWFTYSYAQGLWFHWGVIG